MCMSKDKHQQILYGNRHLKGLFVRHIFDKHQQILYGNDMPIVQK